MNKNNLKTYQRLPEYLKEYVVEQNYEKYTPRDHATWRFIMRQARAYFKDHAHDLYQLGLEKTGISISKIPNIEHMDEVLSDFGWGAVCVCGFIPPLAFLDFQAHNVLPIAADMRTLEHLSYTPAPDIVHEAAGHAPILVDESFAKFLRRYAKMARKAIFSNEDIRLYEAIRKLSDIKENPDSSEEDILKAERDLDQASNEITWVSEAAQVTRMYWWTAEYGLVGGMDDPKIYGAGLLSSIGESIDCFAKNVKKVPFSIKCIEQSYDITKPQPQLFVANDFEELVSALEELEKTMSFSRGGIHAVKVGKRAQYLTTTQFDSGLMVSGEIKDFVAHNDKVSFISWQGPVQLAYEGCQLDEQGSDRHPLGFSLPFGKWASCPGQDPSLLKDSELEGLGISVGKTCTLRFESKFQIVGKVKKFQRHDGKLLVIVWEDCTVEKEGQVYFDPSWGDFDQGVGIEVTSVFGGPADWQNYGSYNLGKASTLPGRMSPYTPEEVELFKLYQNVRDLRSKLEQGKSYDKTEVLNSLDELARVISHTYKNEWVLGIELVEIIEGLLQEKSESFEFIKDLKKTVLNEKSHPSWVAPFIKRGLDLSIVND